jgi:hypothetical protein
MIDEYQPCRNRLGEDTRICPACDKQMKQINFSSHPMADQVWITWECECGKKLYLRYQDCYWDGIHVTERV